MRALAGALALTLALTGCEAELALGGHTPQRALVHRSHLLPAGRPIRLGGAWVEAHVTRAPWSLRLRGSLTIDGAPPRLVAPRDELLLGARRYRVLAVRAWLRDGRLRGGEILLVSEPSRR